MSGDMLDTNVIIKFLSGDNEAKRLIDNATDLSVSVIVLGELYYGVQKSKRKQENLDIFSQFLANIPLIFVDETVAAKYGETKEQLRSIGVNIPENDIWIAATAKAHGCRLITFDEHFTRVDNLVVAPGISKEAIDK